MKHLQRTTRRTVLTCLSNLLSPVLGCAQLMQKEQQVTSVTATKVGMVPPSEIWIRQIASGSDPFPDRQTCVNRAGNREDQRKSTAAHVTSSIYRSCKFALLPLLTGCLLMCISACGNATIGNGGTSIGPSTDGSGSTDSEVVSTNSIAFGTVLVGQTASATVSVTNNGSSPLQLSIGQITGQYFSVAEQNSGTVTIGGGDSYNLNLQFAPLAAGAQTGSLTLTLGSESATIALSGTGQVAAGVLSGLSCSSGSITGAGTDACTVTLNAAAGSGGQVVSLSSSVTAVTVPSSVTVAAGATTASFTATVSAVSTAETATLTASSGGGTQTYAISLGATAQPALSRLSCSSGSITGAGTDACTVTLNAAAGSGGQVVSLSSSVTAVTVPSSVTVAAGATTASFTATVSAVSTAETATLTASSGGGTQAYTISLSATGSAASYEVDLTWDAPVASSDPVEGYNIYRAVSGSSTYELLNSSTEASTTYTDTTVANNTSYTYYVESVDASGNQSAPSNVFSVTIP